MCHSLDLIGHSLDLILQDAAREVSLVADTLNFVQGVSSVIRVIKAKAALPIVVWL